MHVQRYSNALPTPANANIPQSKCGPIVKLFMSANACTAPSQRRSSRTLSKKTAFAICQQMQICCYYSTVAAAKQYDSNSNSKRSVAATIALSTSSQNSSCFDIFSSPPYLPYSGNITEKLEKVIANFQLGYNIFLRSRTENVLSM